MSEETSTSNETKIVITLRKDEYATIGIRRTGCDPFLRTVKGDLTAALNNVPVILAEAEKRWQMNPLYPEADLPAPPAPVPTPPAAHTTTDNAAKSSQSKPQVAMF